MKCAMIPEGSGHLKRRMQVFWALMGRDLVNAILGDDQFSMVVATFQSRWKDAV
jgi:hypothetical protein